MGTNYYLTRDICECCGRGDQKLHIGKSSFGWVFALHVAPESEWNVPKIKGLADWQTLWSEPRTVIRDEYGDRITPEEMLKIICERKHPNGLLRSGIDGRHCIGHGDGTYDLICGEFS